MARAGRIGSVTVCYQISGLASERNVLSWIKGRRSVPTAEFRSKGSRNKEVSADLISVVAPKEHHQKDNPAFVRLSEVMAMTTSLRAPATATHAYILQIPLLAFAVSLSVFFAITFALCILWGLFVADAGMHQLFPMFFPGFVWLTWPGFLIGLAESFIYGWYAAVVFGSLFNFFAAQRG